MLPHKFQFFGQLLFEKKIFLKIPKIVLIVQNYLSFKEDVILYLSKVEFSSHNDALCQVWLKHSGSGEEDTTTTTDNEQSEKLISAFELKREQT